MSDFNGLFDLPITKVGHPKCKGIFFRYYESYYMSSHFSIEFRRSYRLLKKLSCSGCDFCQQIREDVAMCGDVMSVFRESKKPVDGAMYEAVFVSGGIDSETCYCDEWWWELKKVEEDVSSKRVG